MTDPLRTFGLIPAAGKSMRMGRPKLALPLGQSSVLEHVIAALHAAGVGDTLVVIGPHVPELAPLARAEGAHVLRLEVETPDMRATVERGLAWLEERFRPADSDRWLLLPADHPTLDPAVIRQLLEARAETARSIVIPTCGGRRGHPALIDWSHVQAVRGLPSGQGLNVYFRQQQGQTLEVAVESEAVLCDLDTPADYERLRNGGRWVAE
ncbi:MAG: nucleotidyltransferase family protein [Gemmataceae bacterium]|nr:nucleotidyltransferase family protein [Gemmataceae bacterium]